MWGLQGAGGFNAISQSVNGFSRISFAISLLFTLCNAMRTRVSV